MRKGLALSLMIALVMGAFLAPMAEAGRKKRKVSGTYKAPAAAHGEIGGACGLGCVRFATKPTEKFVTLTVVDASGLPVAAGATHPDGPDDDGFVEPIGDFCGKSGKLAITPGEEIIVFVFAGPTTGVFEGSGGPPQCLGTATTGEVKGVLSTR